MSSRLRSIALAAVLLVAAGACSSSGSSKAGNETSSTKPNVSPNTEDIASLTPMDDSVEAGAERLHFKVGPFTVEPGQNNIANRSAQSQQPKEDGWIVGIRPNLVDAHGKTPGVDVIHLHHAVWVNLSAPDATVPSLPERFFAVGEEKTNPQVPARLRLRVQDLRPLAPQLHAPQQHVEAREVVGRATTSTSSRRARPRRRTSRPRGRSGWTCRTARRTRSSTCRAAAATNGEFTYPDEAKNPYQGGPAKNVWTVDQDGTLIATAGHVHPGGLRDDLWLQRAGSTAPSDRGEARVIRHRAPVLVGRPLLRAGRTGLVGRHDVGDTRGLAREGAEGRQALGHRHLRDRSSRRGTRAWGSWSCGWRTTTTPARTRSPPT